MEKLLGTMLSLFICVLTVPTALLYPIIQIEATKSRTVYLFVKNYLVNQNTANKCNKEVILTAVIYVAIAIVFTILFYIICFRIKSIFIQKTKIFLFGIFLLLQFYILQVPFYLFQIGTLYNCENDGQTGMSILVSSPLVSLTLILFGISYDIVKNKLQKSYKQE
ncbi:hypothetical protein [Flavobacterium sp. J27]|uniref:hypothetical protein n=1 Tax=Flavobacterium sp. J27 TaxID=2060419 RepID=UPI00102FD9A0|nr:hypothetical protein [Flavobacterium sp. J27]